MDLKEFETQIADWSQRIDTKPQKVSLEVAIAQFILIYNINENVSLIRDMMAKKLCFKP